MTRIGLWLLGGAVLAAGAPALAQPKPDSCFRLSQLESTRPDGDRRIYARVGVTSVYRIDLAHRCSSLGSAASHLVIVPTGGRDLICGPLDFDLKVNDEGAVEPCFVQSITKLSPEEAAAIPKRAKP